MTSPAPTPSASTPLDRTDRAPIVHRSRTRSARQQQLIVDAARRLVSERGAEFTTQELIKEAGVALQTFYRYFAGKDQLLLALLEDLIAEAAGALETQARELSDPVARLRFYVTELVGTIARGDRSREARFVTAEHWRLHQRFPEEISRATQPVTDLIERDLRAAADEGRLHPRDPGREAWFAMRLVMSVYHHYAFVEHDERTGNLSESLWAFCLSAFGGSPPDDGAT